MTQKEVNDIIDIEDFVVGLKRNANNVFHKSSRLTPTERLRWLQEHLDKIEKKCQEIIATSVIRVETTTSSSA